MADKKHQIHCDTEANLGNRVSKVRVAQQQPAARRNAVGLVLKLLRPHLVEVAEAVTTNA